MADDKNTSNSYYRSTPIPTFAFRGDGRGRPQQTDTARPRPPEVPLTPANNQDSDRYYAEGGLAAKTTALKRQAAAAPIYNVAHVVPVADDAALATLATRIVAAYQKGYLHVIVQVAAESLLLHAMAAADLATARKELTHTQRHNIRFETAKQGAAKVTAAMPAAVLQRPATAANDPALSLEQMRNIVFSTDPTGAVPVFDAPDAPTAQGMAPAAPAIPVFDTPKDQPAMRPARRLRGPVAPRTFPTTPPEATVAADKSVSVFAPPPPANTAPGPTPVPPAPVRPTRVVDSDPE